MTRTLFAFVAACAASAGAALGAPITYDVDVAGPSFLSGTESLLGTITTDGVFGTLHASDITAWNLRAMGTDNFSLSSGTSELLLLPGSDLSASSTALTAGSGYALFFNLTSGDWLALDQGGLDFVGTPSTTQVLPAESRVFATAGAVAAPEIDGASAAGGLLLLGAAVAIARGRRPAGLAAR